MVIVMIIRIRNIILLFVFLHFLGQSAEISKIVPLRYPILRQNCVQGMMSLNIPSDYLQPASIHC